MDTGSSTMSHSASQPSWGAPQCEEFSWRYLPPAVYAEPEPPQDRSGLVGGEITVVEPRHRQPPRRPGGGHD